MARSRRRRMSAQPRRRFDWVYRSRVLGLLSGDSVEEGVAEVQGLASYYGALVSLTSGPANARALIMYDSTNRLVQGYGTTNFALGPHQGYTNRAARAEGRKALIRACEGTIIMRPSTWAAGNYAYYGWRLGVFKQDPDTGLLIVPSEYTMFDETWAPFGSTATWANTRGWVMERRIMRPFNPDNSSGYHHLTFRWSSRKGRALEPDECFAMYLESDTGSVTLTTEPWCRTLVSDEG